LQLREQVAADPRFTPETAMLADLRGMSQFLDSAAMQMLADRFVSKPLGTAKRALVADTDAVYGMLRMLTTLSDNAQNRWRVFRTIEEAEECLNE
jgi:hypothetical protein